MCSLYFGEREREREREWLCFVWRGPEYGFVGLNVSLACQKFAVVTNRSFQTTAISVQSACKQSVVLSEVDPHVLQYAQPGFSQVCCSFFFHECMYVRACLCVRKHARTCVCVCVCACARACTHGINNCLCN